jgi:hypothetical protein
VSEVARGEAERGSADALGVDILERLEVVADRDAVTLVSALLQRGHQEHRGDVSVGGVRAELRGVPELLRALLQRLRALDRVILPPRERAKPDPVRALQRCVGVLRRAGEGVEDLPLPVALLQLLEADDVLTDARDVREHDVGTGGGDPRGLSGAVRRADRHQLGLHDVPAALAGDFLHGLDVHGTAGGVGGEDRDFQAVGVIAHLLDGLGEDIDHLRGHKAVLEEIRRVGVEELVGVAVADHRHLVLLPERTGGSVSRGGGVAEHRDGALVIHKLLVVGDGCRAIRAGVERHELQGMPVDPALGVDVIDVGLHARQVGQARE